jgi:type IV pilus assembly protein PilX
MTPAHRRPRRPIHASHQAGVILLIVLVALVALLSAGIALVRSSDVGLLQAGNLAFQRDLHNQAERGIKAALAQFDATGVLASDAARNANQPAINYSARRLATDARGMPLALLSESQLGTVGKADNDLVDKQNAVKVRTVIDRLCANAGAYSAATCTNFSPAIGKTPGPVDSQDRGNLTSAELPVYRISVRATGPRNTQVFLQTTLSR